MRQLTRLSEPLLLFGHGQAMEDPRDGLTLFGPFDTGSVFAIRTGVVGTPSGIERFKAWTQRIKMLVRTKNPIQARPPFPGFEAVFRIPWSDAPLLIRTIDEEELKKRLFQDDRHQRVFQTVDAISHLTIAWSRSTGGEALFSVLGGVLHRIIQHGVSLRSSRRVHDINVRKRLPLR